MSSSLKNLFSSGSRSPHNNRQDDETEIPPVYNEPFFYGRITRQESEDILKINGMEEGLYLLRESITPMGNFSLSLVHGGNIAHYSIEKQIDGKYMILDGVPFSDPVSLIHHYQAQKNGFVTMPKVPCIRLLFQEAIAFRGISYKDLHRHMKANAKKLKANMARAFGPMRESLLMHTLKSMHKEMPWFHGEISREEGNKRVQNDGHQDGKFLIRARADGQSFALTISQDNNFRQYIILVNDGETYSLESGQLFKALIILVDHYHNRRDGLACKLETPVPNLDFYSQTWNNYQQLSWNLTQKKGAKEPVENSNQHRVLSTRPVPSDPESIEQRDDRSKASGVASPSYTKQLDDSDDDYEEAEHLENMYLCIRTVVQNMNLKLNDITLDDILGSGQFGDVKRGTCKIGKENIPVAVKTLKNNNPTAEKEILDEADLMKRLDHPNIVRIIGVCKTDSIMLVMELAELGPLKKYLEPHRKNGTTMKVWHLLEMMVQICEGMVYLESKEIVHRDLATRNVLLMTEHFAKISDFGLSRMVDSGSEYYRAHGPGRWPLMWYAPECLYYHKFDSKTDVWSFGITMWEIMSYGAKPYDKKKPNEILFFLEDDQRMAKPKNCDDRIYEIMLKCWEFNKNNRPNFKEVKRELEPLFQEYKIYKT